MTITVNIKEAKELLVTAMKAGVVPMLHGSPATGKSSVPREIAEEYNLQLIDLRLSQCDPVDLNGFAYIDKETGKASYRPMDMFPIEGEEPPKGKVGWLLFLDEFNSADRGTQKAAYKLLLDRMVGQYKLHDSCAVMCAGNLSTDNAIVEEMGTALQSRMMHLELAVNNKQWLDWAAESGLDTRITSFINFKPQLLYNFQPNHDDKTFASPRTWEFADRLLKAQDKDSSLTLPLLAGTLSEAVAREFLAFTKVYKKLPTIDEVLDDVNGKTVPTEPSIQYAITGMIAEHLTEELAPRLVRYLKHLPIEFQSLCIREANKRHTGLLGFDAISDWITEQLH